MGLSEAAPNVAEFTVSELAFDLKRRIEDAYGYVRVRGEISGYRGPHASGHAYFALKDEGAKIDAVVWRGVFARLRFKPEEGLEVVATGKLTTYPGSSKYQIVIDQIEPAGAGALMLLLEERRKKLLAEGLFDPARKQLLPEFPRVVGVVTSPTGAVIRDILHRLADRFPLHVIVWPVRVQGETSAAEVAAAIAGFDALPEGGPVPRPDVLIVARGGGSLEDLWSFNEEIVVRAAAACTIPLVSAVGHETDTTLIDFVADVRAPTPTAAAELIVPVRVDLLAAIDDLGSRLRRATLRTLEQRRREFAGAARSLPRPESLLALPRQRFDAASGRLPRALVAEIRAKGVAFARVAGRIAPATVIARVARKRERFGLIAARMAPGLLERPIARHRERFAALTGRAVRAFLAATERQSARLRRAGSLLESLSYRSVLGRGFALVRGADGAALSSAAAMPPGSRIEIEFADGRVRATTDGAKAKSPSARRKQDDLFD